MGARELLSELEAAGCAVRADGGDVVIRPASKLPADLVPTIAATKAELIELLSRRTCIAARLLRSGWTAEDAAATATRIAGRDASDDRRTCTECRNYRPALHKCQNHRRADMMTADISRDLSGLHQRCPGFEEIQP
jgi:hypothetical protein